MNVENLRRNEIPGRVTVVAGNGGLAKIVVTTKSSTAEIYPHGAHVAHFQKNGEPPLIFMSHKSWFAPGKAIRGGVPICFPWFGNRDGEPSHGFARVAEWEFVKSAAAPDGTVTLHFALPQLPGREAWKNLRTEFIVTVADTLTMELTAANDACGEALEIEDCLHTYFHVGDIAAVSLTGSAGASRSTILPLTPMARGETPIILRSTSLRKPTVFIRTTPVRLKSTMRN